MNCSDSEARVGIGGEDILGRLALANGKTKYLHLAIQACHTTGPAKDKTLAEKEQSKEEITWILWLMTEIF